MRATGSFDVKLGPLDSYEPSLGRRSIDKQFQGDLEAISKGEMQAAMGSVQGSGAYVAIERVTGTLAGKSGSFVLYHASTMTRGAPEQSIRVVPDSGTDGLVGLSGALTIIIADGKHSYEFNYEIAS